MSRRLSLLSAAAFFALLAAPLASPAQAGDSQTANTHVSGYGYAYPHYYRPYAPTSVGISGIANVAQGKGNVAQQRISGVSGTPFYGWGGTSVGISGVANVAEGKGNVAQQEISGVRR
jgi:hypothetical protein